MPSASKAEKLLPQQLLVEGKNDQHVIWALCKQYKLPETFSVISPSNRSVQLEEADGIEAILEILPVKLKEPDLKTLGIVVDADQDISARWTAIRDRLGRNGYQNIPESPIPNGWVCPSPNDFPPRIGVWIMPNNQLPGMIEDFAKYLISTDDLLLQIAEATLQDIEQRSLNRYTLVHHSKALIHTWLAWQDKPGIPMGQAITAKVLKHDADLASAFVSWLTRLFDLEV